jgi:uncharacterized protein YecE (DUF72 family)
MKPLETRKKQGRRSETQRGQAGQRSDTGSIARRPNAASRRSQPVEKIFANIHVGTSGWHYKHWVGPVYPLKTPSGEMLGLYQKHFDTVEVNNSFYRLPTDAMFDAWKKKTPPDFRFALKGSRFLTHMKKLKDPEQGIEEFFAGARRLGKKLGPIVFQLPPFWKLNLERLEAFLKALPPRHRYAFEFRNPTWHVPEVLALLRRHNAAFCIFEIGGFRSPLEVTADFAYIRLHGPDAAKYQGSYAPKVLEEWADRLRGWSRAGVESWIYFDNDQYGYAAMNARDLRSLLRGG